MGKTSGQIPFDELFILGLERDNDLWLRGLVALMIASLEVDTREELWCHYCPNVEEVGLFNRMITRVLLSNLDFSI